MQLPHRLAIARLACLRPAPLACVVALSLIGTLVIPAESAASTAPNAAPRIWGQPSATATRGTLYTFQPRAADADGDRLTFSIDNKPRWMWFSPRTGRLSGWPKWAQRNRTFAGIVIRVSDGHRTVALPAFSIRVGNASGGGGNHPPRITGTPVTAAVVGRPYAFRPSAADTDGDSLRFRIAGKPAWAAFDPATGALYGTPIAADVGRYDRVRIGVGDGKASAALAPFSIVVSPQSTGSRSVTLTWTAPTRNTDGSALTDLSGYVVSYGQTSRGYTQTLRVPAAATRSAVIEGLTSGRWYFALQSVNDRGVTSDYTAEVTALL